MAPDRDVFGISGPTYLTSVNWKCPNHRRSIAASLVQSVYILENDRQENRHDSESLAPPWHDFFLFKPIRILVDDVDSSIFGAIFQFNAPASAQNSTIAHAPDCIVAFRGTMTKKSSVNRDLSLDLNIIQNGLHKSSRSEIANQAVQNVVSEFKTLNIWLAGHSLGAAIATIISRRMAKEGKFLNTFLFNPPFFSAPIEKIRDKHIKHGIRIANSLITAGLTIALKKPNLDDSFAKLSSWVPCIFVHPDDHICSEYIGYFEHRKNMENIGAGIIERLATQNSIGDLVFRSFGKESDPLHLIPSASLTVNLSPTKDFRRAHSIHQWWKLDLHLHTRLFRYEI